MIRRYGIDTSVLVRLLTGDPEKDFQYCVNRLRALIDEQGSEIFASNQVVGEAYIAVQHHYGVSKAWPALPCWTCCVAVWCPL